MTAPLPETFPWRFTGGRRLAPAPFLVAGIVNLTPDSFSDGGLYVDPASALERVRRVLAEGGRMIDLGAESTRPGAANIGPEEEWRRLEPVLDAALDLRNRMTEADAAFTPFAVSIDTWRARTAVNALSGEQSGQIDARVDIINDISGGLLDPDMDAALAEFRPGYVLGHCPVTPSAMQRHAVYDDVVETLVRHFSERMNALVRAGLPEDRIVLDPCIGFAKTPAHAAAIFAGLERLTALGRPLYLGISRKSFLPVAAGYSASSPPLSLDERDTLTRIGTALLAARGVRIHRVHDVGGTVTALRMAAFMGKI